MEAKGKPQATETKNKARDPLDAAAKGVKAERNPVRKLVSILLLKAHDDKTDDACAEAILSEAKNGYGLLFLGLGAESMAATHNFPPTIEKIIREFAGPIAIALHRRAASLPSALFHPGEYGRVGGNCPVPYSYGRQRSTPRWVRPPEAFLQWRP